MITLITGGTGFIGSRLALTLREDQQSVRVLAALNNDNEARAAETLRAKGVGMFEGDVTKEESVKRAMEGVQTVYHLAAAQHESGVDDSYFRNINVKGTDNVARIAAAAGVKNFVHGSTIGVYGIVNDEEVVTEKTATNPDNIYGQTKLEAEGVISNYATEIGAKIARISETYGPGDFRLLKMFKSIRKGFFPRIGHGMNTHQLVFVDDLIAGMRSAATSGSNGEVYLLGGDEQITTRDMIDTIARSVGSKFAGPTVPMFAMEGITRANEIVANLIDIKPLLHQRRLDFFKKSFKLDCAKARAELGFSATVSFTSGTQVTAKWYAEHGYL